MVEGSAPKRWGRSLVEEEEGGGASNGGRHQWRTTRLEGRGEATTVVGAAVEGQRGKRKWRCSVMEWNPTMGWDPKEEVVMRFRGGCRREVVEVMAAFGISEEQETMVAERSQQGRGRGGKAESQLRRRRRKGRTERREGRRDHGW